MRRITLGIWLAVAAIVPARAVAATAAIGISASPNPAALGDKVVHVVTVGVASPLDVWVSATGFEQPHMGTLPAGNWRLECCPAATGGSWAWHYRSSSVVAPSRYRFGAVSRARGWFASTAATAYGSDAVWIRIA